MASKIKARYFLLIIISLFTLLGCAIQTSNPIAQIAPIQPTPQLQTVTNLVFHDYNGSGTREDREPPIEGIKLSYQPGDYSCITDTDGRGSIKLPAGNYSLHVYDASKKFRYILPSISEVIPIERGVNANIIKDTQIALPIAEGFLTLPFDNTVPIVVDSRVDYFDHDPGPDSLWWDGTRLKAPRPHRTLNAHIGIDFLMSGGKFLYAAAPGKIRNIVDPTGPENLLKTIVVDFSDGFGAIYAHVSSFLVTKGQVVSRGEKIAISGQSGTSIPHTELSFYKYVNNVFLFIDPYIPTSHVMEWIESTNNNGVWASGKDLKWETYPFTEKWPLLGYWTKSNDPQYP